ncbi:MAG: tetratricopeptide repeat protein, partial [Deltaproteobacteria bacterium]|nr:tetratricopeptide repeat protein [Deltaproteobacteria bacterium]
MILLTGKILPDELLLSKIFIVILTFFILATNHRNKIWNRGEILWQDNIKKASFKPRPYNNLGTYYMKEKKYARAIDNFTKALQLDPACALSYNNLGSAYETQGNHQEAKRAYEKALDISPSYAKAFYNFGNLYYRQK